MQCNNNAIIVASTQRNYNSCVMASFLKTKYWGKYGQYQYLN